MNVALHLMQKLYAFLTLVGVYLLDVLICSVPLDCASTRGTRQEHCNAVLEWASNEQQHKSLSDLR